MAKGYYSPLADRLVEIINDFMSDGDSFLDAGCGSGYYLNALIQNAAKKLNYYAADVAKKAVAMCARLNPEAVCFVGNVFHLPFEEGSLNGLMSVFCPYSSEEFARVVKNEGYVIAVSPGAGHLYEMKEIVYRQAYENDESGYTLAEFETVMKSKLVYKVQLQSSEDIEALWRMTPYYHTTYIEDSKRLTEYERLETTCDFLISIYRRKIR